MVKCKRKNVAISDKIFSVYKLEFTKISPDNFLKLWDIEQYRAIHVFTICLSVKILSQQWSLSFSNEVRKKTGQNT